MKNKDINNIQDQATKLHTEIDNYQLIINRLQKEHSRIIDKEKMLSQENLNLKFRLSQIKASLMNVNNLEALEKQNFINEDHESMNQKKSTVGESNSQIRSNRRIIYNKINSSNLISGINAKQNEKF